MTSKRTFFHQHSHRILMLIPAIFLPILAFARLIDVYQNNTWSLRFYDGYRDGSPVEPDMSLPPERHERAQLWLALDALAEGQPEQAQIYIQPALAENNIDAQVVFGMSLAEQGDLEGAVATWAQVGYVDGLLTAARMAEHSRDMETAATAYLTAWELEPVEVTSEYIDFLRTSNQSQDRITAIMEKVVDLPASDPEKAAWLLKIGEVFTELGTLDQAAQAYLLVLELEPDSFSAYFNLGNVLQQSGDYPERAREAFLKAMEIKPENAPAHFAMARILIDEGRYAEADPWLQAAIELNPEEKWYWYERGRIAYLAGDMNLSFEAFQDAVQKFPDWSPPYFEQSRTLFDLGRTQQALRSIQVAIALMNPPDPLYYLRAANMYRQLDRNEEALQAYKAAWSLDPDGTTTIYADFLRWEYMDLDLAAEVLRNAVDIMADSPNRASWLVSLGDILRAQSRFEDAEWAYLEARASNPDDPDVYIGLGSVYHARGEGLEIALKTILKAIELDQKNARAYFTVGHILVQEKLYADSDAWLAQAIVLDPEARWYWYERGRSAYLAGDLEAARSIFSAAIERFPEWDPPHFELALTLMALDRPHEALTHVQAAIQYTNTPNSWHYVRAARIYEMLGETTSAIEAYRKALNIDPANQSAILSLRLLDEDNPSLPENEQPA